MTKTTDLTYQDSYRICQEQLEGTVRSVADNLRRAYDLENDDADYDDGSYDDPYEEILDLACDSRGASYTCDQDGRLTGIELTMAWGGPNVYVDLHGGRGEVRGVWWEHHFSIALPSDVASYVFDLNAEFADGLTI